MPNLIVADTHIHQDAEGRYSLNDLHRAAIAAGITKDIRPNEWLALDQTDALAEVLITENPGIKPIDSRAGRYGGTYVAKELVYAYAMWISPAFNLKVIRAYDASTMKKGDPTPNLPAIKAQTLFVAKAAELLRLSETSTLRLLGNVAANCGLPSNLLPTYSDEGLTRALGDLLKEHGSTLSAVKANPILQSLGYLEKLERRASKGKTKEFWSVIAAGQKYGKNETAPANPNETQPRWYVGRFGDLMVEIEAAGRIAA